MWRMSVEAEEHFGAQRERERAREREREREAYNKSDREGKQVSIAAYL